MHDGTRVLHLHVHDLKVNVGGMEFDLPGLRSGIVSHVRRSVVRSKGIVWGRTSKLWCCRGCPKVLCVCITAFVAIGGVILGVAQVSSSGEMCAAPRGWVRSCCQSPAAAVERAQHRWNQLQWTLRSSLLLPGRVANFGGFMGFLAHPEIPARSRACSRGSWMLIPALWFYQGRTVLSGSPCSTAGRSCVSLHDRVILDNSALFFKYVVFQGGSR